MSDNVKHPSHYATGDIECIDAIEAILGPVLFLGFLWGNAIKYMWRWPRKGLDEDIEKCEEYLARIKEKGYTIPATFDSESGCMVPNPALATLIHGVVVDEVPDSTGEHARFA